MQKQPSFCEVLIRFQKFVLLSWCDGHQLLYEIIITIWVGSMFCYRYFKSTRNQSAFRADMLLRYLPLALCALGLWPWMVLRLAPQWSWGEGRGPLVCNLPNSTWVWELLVTGYLPWSKISTLLSIRNQFLQPYASFSRGLRTCKAITCRFVITMLRLVACVQSRVKQRKLLVFYSRSLAWTPLVPFSHLKLWFKAIWESLRIVMRE